MKDLNILIEEQIQEMRLERLFFYSKDEKSRENFVAFFRQSLQEIAQATIEAIKVEEMPRQYDKYKFLFKEGHNAAVTEQDQKAKQFLGDKE